MTDFMDGQLRGTLEFSDSEDNYWLKFIFHFLVPWFKYLFSSLLLDFKISYNELIVAQFVLYKWI